MKFNVQSKLLLTRLNAVSKVVSSKNAYAILDNFLFELQSDRIVVTGSDMETRLTTNIEVQNVEGSGKFALDVKRTINSLKELPDTAHPNGNFDEFVHPNGFRSMFSRNNHWNSRECRNDCPLAVWG